MTIGCANSIMKFLFFFISLLICIFGALVCIFSLWANLDKDFGSHLADFVSHVDGINPETVKEMAEYQASLWVLVAVGALLFFVGLFGCCGAGCESPVFLGMFIFIIVVLTSIELGAVVFAMNNRDDFVSSIHQVLEKSSATSTLRKNIRPIQSVFQCCGATKETQYLYIDDGLCGSQPIRHPINCFDRIAHMVQSWGESIVVIVFLLMTIELLAILFSCCLCRQAQNFHYAPYHL